MRYRMEVLAVVTLDDEDRILTNAEITWEEGIIQSIGPAGSDLSSVDQTIKVPQGILLPGFYNGHNHAAMSLFRGYADDSPLFEWLQKYIWPIEQRLTADDIYGGTMLACAEMIRTGTVGFADMYFEVDAVATAVRDSGLRGWISRGLIGDQDSGLEKLEESVSFAERWRGQAEGRVIGMLGPHAPYTCSPEYLTKVAERALDHQLGIHIHLAESLDEMEQMRQRYGKTPIQIAHDAGVFANRTILAHGVHIQPEDIQWLTGMQGGVVSCPVSNAKLGNGILPYELLNRSGVAVGLGTDGAASTNTLDMFQEMKAMAWMQKVRNQAPDSFKAKDALRAATRGSADVLGFSGGRLTVGRPADFIVVDGHRSHLTPDLDLISNLVYAAVGQDVVYTVVQGKILMAEGIITAFEEEHVIDEAKERVRVLIGGARK